MADGISLYMRPESMEPLLPSMSRGMLAELSCEIFRRSGRLAAQMPAAINRQRIALLVREMNSCYSNLIEGHKTLPREIEAALRKDYSGDPKERANQHLALAHIEVEGLMMQRLQSEPELCLHSRDFLQWLHRKFYEQLPKELRFGETRTGKKIGIEPGKLRTIEVTVGAHQPPAHSALPAFLARFEKFYGDAQILATEQIVALAAAHHRLAWIHPFTDGNGRVIRLFTHAWLARCEIDGLGLWTLSRGLARTRSECYRMLSQADQRRINDFDGRGNLSERHLAEFVEYFLKVMLDQIAFMEDLLLLPTLAARVERHLQIDLVHLKSTDRERLARLLKAALVEGEIERGRVKEIVGQGESTARAVIRLAQKEQLMNSQTPKGPLALVFSSRSLETYFPRLFQDLPVAG